MLQYIVFNAEHLLEDFKVLSEFINAALYTTSALPQAMQTIEEHISLLQKSILATYTHSDLVNISKLIVALKPFLSMAGEKRWYFHFHYFIDFLLHNGSSNTIQNVGTQMKDMMSFFKKVSGGEGVLTIASVLQQIIQPFTKNDSSGTDFLNNEKYTLVYQLLGSDDHIASVESFQRWILLNANLTQTNHSLLHKSPLDSSFLWMEFA